MRNERKIIVRLIESDKVHNHRLLAEFFANKIKERGVENEKI
jgi:hypothetical protein